MIRHAQDHQVGVAAAREEAALGQARAHGRSETAVPNDLDFLEHRPSRQGRVLAAAGGAGVSVTTV